MGNIGRSSTGCFLCRKRKIKCDERKEGGCKKCEQIKKKCPGYPFVIELDISTSRKPLTITNSLPLITPPIPSQAHEADDYIKEEIEPVGCCDKIGCGLMGTLTKCDCTSSTITLDQVPRHTSPTPPPTYDVTHQSTCFFLNLFCFQASQLYNAPLLDYLPSLLKSTSPDHSIHQAMKAVSRATLADRYSGCDIRLQTGKDYVQALSATKATIKDEKEIIKDETVLAVWLLGLYEALTNVLLHGKPSVEHRTADEEWRSHVSHIRGAMHLLRVRGRSQLNNPRAEKIYRIFKAGIQIRLFMLNSITSTEFENLEQDVCQDEHEFLPSKTASKATTYFHKVARFLEQMKRALRACEAQHFSSKTMQEMSDLLQEGETLDSGMAGWSKTEPGWDIMRMEAKGAETVWSQYPTHALYYFGNFWVYLYWFRYLIARFKLYEALTSVVKRHKEVQNNTSGNSEPLRRLDFQTSQYETIARLTAGQLIGLTAYALGDITNGGSFDPSIVGHTRSDETREVNVVAALQLIIPLKVLLRSDVPTVTQKRAADTALTLIGDGFRRQPTST